MMVSRDALDPLGPKDFEKFGCFIFENIIEIKTLVKKEPLGYGMFTSGELIITVRKKDVVRLANNISYSQRISAYSVVLTEWSDCDDLSNAEKFILDSDGRKYTTREFPIKFETYERIKVLMSRGDL